MPFEQGRRKWVWGSCLECPLTQVKGQEELAEGGELRSLMECSRAPFEWWRVHENLGGQWVSADLGSGGSACRASVMREFPADQGHLVSFRALQSHTQTGQISLGWDMGGTREAAAFTPERTPVQR